MATRGNIDRLYALSTEQWGLFTSAQALSVHVSRNQLSRMVADGRLEPMAYGVYRVAAGGETEHAAVKAAWLSLYPSKTAFERLGAFPYDAVATGRTAAYMQGYGDFYETPYCFIVDRKKRSTREDLELVHAPAERRDVDLRLGIPVATPERTLADLVRLDEDPSLVNDYIASAALSGHTFDERRLTTLLDPLCRRRGYSSGADYSSALLGNSALPAALSSALSAVVKVLESYEAFRNVPRLSKTINGALPAEAASRIATAAAIQQSARIPPGAIAQIAELSKRLTDISKLVDSESLQRALQTYATISTRQGITSSQR